MQGYGKEWGEHFHVKSPPTIVVQPKSDAHFAVTRLRTAVVPPDVTTTPTEDSMMISVVLHPIGKGLWNHWTDGQQLTVPTVPAFHSSVFDLQAPHMVSMKTPFDALHFNIPRKTVDKFTDDHELARISTFRTTICENDHALANLSRLILPFLEDERERTELFLDHFGLLLVARLVDGYTSSSKLKLVNKGGLAPWQKRRAEELLSNHLAGDLRLERLARESNLSPGHFARAFKTSFGISVHRWIVNKRIDYAKALMSQGKLPLPDIAERTGFSGQSTFTRAFQQRVGMSPGQWRRSAVTPTRAKTTMRRVNAVSSLSFSEVSQLSVD
jgi:AraC family transcriptional regulator